MMEFMVNAPCPCPEEAKKDRLLSKDYVLITLSASGTSFMNFFVAAVLTLYLERIGGLRLHAGLMSTFFSIASLVSRPLIGTLSDKFGRVRFLVVGALICAAMSALFGMTAVIPVLFIIRAFNGVGFSMHSTCAGAVAADVLPASRLNEGIGYFAMHSTIAQAVGPWIAIAIVYSDTLASYRLLFLIAAALCLMSAAASASITYERKRRKALAGQQSSAPPPVKAELSGMRNDEPLPKTFLGFEYTAYPTIAVMILLYFGIVGIMLFIPPFARWKGFGNAGLFFAISAIGIFIARIIFGKVADRRGADIVIIPWIAVLAVCLFALPFVGSTAAFIAIGIPLGFAQGAVMPTFNAMLFQRCSPSRRGSASGSFFAAIDIGFAIGAPMLGAIADARDFGYIFWVGAIFVALSLVLYLLISSDKKYNAKRKSI